MKFGSKLRFKGSAFIGTLTVFVLLMSLAVFAAPGNPFPQEFTQSDGSVIILTVGGDESFNWFEDRHGNIVLFDVVSRNFTYAYIRDGELLPNPAHIVGQAPMPFSPFGTESLPVIRFDDIVPLILAAERIEPIFDFETFVERHSLFNHLGFDGEGNARFARGGRPGEITPIIPERVTQEIFPVLIEFTQPIMVGETAHYAMFRDSRHEDRFGVPIFEHIYEDLPGMEPGTTATAFWGRKFFDRYNPTGSIVGYFDEQAFGVISRGDDNTFFAPSPVIPNLLPGAEGNRVTGTLRNFNANNLAAFAQNEIGYEVYVDTKWNIIRVTFDMRHPAPSNNSQMTREIIAAAMNVVLYDDNDRPRNPDIWPRTANNVAAIPAHVHPYAIIAGFDAASGNGAGLGQTWAHAWSMTGNGSAAWVDRNTSGMRKRWSQRAYAHNGEIFNGGRFTIGANNFLFGTMDIGVIAHELGHTLGVGDTYDTAGNSLSLRPYSLMAHGSWGTVIDEIPGSTPTRIDPLHMIEMGMIHPDQIIIVESIEDFEVTLHPFYLSDSFYEDMHLNTPVGSPRPEGTKFFPINNVPNPDYNILMIWAPEHRAAFHEAFAGTSAVHARQVPTEFFLLDVRLPMGFDRGMTRYGIGVNKANERLDPRGFDHTAIVDSRAVQGMFPGAPATTPENNGFMIDGGILVFHYDRTASPTSFNPQNANFRHKRANLIPADGSDLLFHQNNVSYNASYGTNYATHDYFVNMDHFFSNDLTRSVVAANIAPGGGNVSTLSTAYERYREEYIYARGIRLNRLSNGFRLSGDIDLTDPSTWAGGTFGLGEPTGYQKLPAPLPGAPGSNALIFEPNQPNTFPVSHFYDRNWPGTGNANINASRGNRNGGIPSGFDLEFPDSRFDAIENGMRVINRVWDVEINLYLDGEPFVDSGKEFVLRLAQYEPHQNAHALIRSQHLPIRSHPASLSWAEGTNVVTTRVTNGDWKIFAIIDGVEVDTHHMVTVFEGLHTDVTIDFGYFQRASLLVENYVFEVSDALVTIEAVERNLEEQLVELFAEYNINLEPVVNQWRITHGGDGRYFLMDPNSERNANAPLDVIIVPSGLITFADVVAVLSEAAPPILPVNFRETPEETITALRVFVLSLFDEDAEFAFDITDIRQWAVALGGNGEFFLMDPDSSTNLNHQIVVYPVLDARAFDNGTFFRIWPEGGLRIPFEAEITAIDQDGNDVPVTKHQMWEDVFAGNEVFGSFDISKEIMWQSLTFTIRVFGQEWSVELENDMFALPPVLSYTVFAEDWRESINLRFFLDGVPVEIPLADMELIVDGILIENIRDYTLNIAGWQTAHNTVFICKLRHNWQHLSFSVTAHGQTLSFEFTNSMFDPPVEELDAE